VSPAGARVLSLVLRLGLGALFVVAGALKLGDPTQFAIEITNYRLAAPLAPYLAITLPFVELVHGLALVLLPGAWRRGAALALGGLTAMFTIAVAQAVGRGINIDCGCFGGRSGPVSWVTVARDVTLIAVSIAILWLEREKPLHRRGTVD
jgi:uncharacterized membrane protein YphA (DoxX/SURF4 family)